MCIRNPGTVGGGCPDCYGSCDLTGNRHRSTRGCVGRGVGDVGTSGDDRPRNGSIRCIGWGCRGGYGDG